MPLRADLALGTRSRSEVRRAEAINELTEILLPRAYLEALYVIQAELERAEPGSMLSDAELERATASRGADRFRQVETTRYMVHFPSSWIRQILERFASGKTSLLEESAARVATRGRKKRSTSRSASSNAAIDNSECT